MNTNIFETFVTKLFVLLLIVGLAPLVTSTVAEAGHGDTDAANEQHPDITGFTIVPPSRAAGPSMYATVRQKAYDAGWLRHKALSSPYWTTATRTAAQQEALYDTGFVDQNTGFSTAAAHMNPINVWVIRFQSR